MFGSLRLVRWHGRLFQATVRIYMVRYDCRRWAQLVTPPSGHHNNTHCCAGSGSAGSAAGSAASSSAATSRSAASSRATNKSRHGPRAKVLPCSDDADADAESDPAAGTGAHTGGTASYGASKATKAMAAPASKYEVTEAMDAGDGTGWRWRPPSFGGHMSTSGGGAIPRLVEAGERECVCA